VTHCPDDRRLGAQEPRRFWKCETRLPLATAEDAGITRFHRGTLETIGATSELVSSTDKLQYTLLSGPCIDAVLGEGMFHTGQLRSESRWPQFGPQAFEATGVQSMLSYRLFVEEQGDAVTCLNFYSTKPHAFDLWSQTHRSPAGHARRIGPRQRTRPGAQRELEGGVGLQPADRWRSAS